MRAICRLYGVLTEQFRLWVWAGMCCQQINVEIITHVFSSWSQCWLCNPYPLPVFSRVYLYRHQVIVNNQGEVDQSFILILPIGLIYQLLNFIVAHSSALVENKIKFICFDGFIWHEISFYWFKITEDETSLLPALKFDEHTFNNKNQYPSNNYRPTKELLGPAYVKKVRVWRPSISIKKKTHTINIARAMPVQLELRSDFFL